METLRERVKSQIQAGGEVELKSHDLTDEQRSEACQAGIASCAALTAAEGDRPGE
jgi:hypothetical protein